MFKNKQHIIWGVSAVSIAVMGAIVWRTTKAKQKIDLKKFDSPDSPGSGRCMDRQFIRMLQKLEKKSKYPIFRNINSGARTAYWNTKVGGVSNSSHKIPTCKAADISMPTKSIRNKIVVAAKLVGFKRIGVGKTFVHLDSDDSKSQYVAWGYPKGAKPPINPFV
ncbi:D-Ala-D-Ala carboxypeptidase family metallohydrolase [Aquimarina macrocephali]|uniref:D-Ala-D-Ala carboxypeptidase family metallohydrolase n=1 Tax=Aquimarina macrocephali TaxID=666563 RepID=UPI0004ACC5A0|nr:D-Ala-D-Ala carboxypeptidase family metallohydrolase [Aquimarina macrocephali]